jgi:hypothetical protein
VKIAVSKITARVILRSQVPERWSFDDDPTEDGLPMTIVLQEFCL